MLTFGIAMVTETDAEYGLRQMRMREHLVWLVPLCGRFLERKGWTVSQSWLVLGCCGCPQETHQNPTQYLSTCSISTCQCFWSSHSFVGHLSKLLKFVLQGNAPGHCASSKPTVHEGRPLWVALDSSYALLLLKSFCWRVLSTGLACVP